MQKLQASLLAGTAPVHTQPADEQPASAARLLTKSDLLKRIPISYPTLWKLMRVGKFPRSRMIGARVFWLESEVEDWLAALPLQRLKGDAA